MKYFLNENTIMNIITVSLDVMSIYIHLISYIIIFRLFFIQPFMYSNNAWIMFKCESQLLIFFLLVIKHIIDLSISFEPILL